MRGHVQDAQLRHASQEEDSGCVETRRVNGRRGLLNYSFVPHIVEAIARFSDPATRLVLSWTCQALRVLIRNPRVQVEITAGRHPINLPAANYHGYDDWRVPPQIPAVRRERNAVTISHPIFHSLDIRGPLSVSLLTTPFANAEVIRLRSSPDGIDFRDKLDLTGYSARQVIIFPPGGQYCSLGDVPRFPVDFPRTVKRIVYPLAVDIKKRLFLTSLLPSRGIFLDPTWVGPTGRELVLICPPSSKDTRESDDFGYMAESLICAMVSGLLWGANIKIVDLAVLIPDDSDLQPVKKALEARAAGLVDSANANHLASHPFPYIHPSGELHIAPPDGQEAMRRIEYVTREEYRAGLKPGQWELETVQVMPGFE